MDLKGLIAFRSKIESQLFKIRLLRKERLVSASDFKRMIFESYCIINKVKLIQNEQNK